MKEYYNAIITLITTMCIVMTFNDRKNKVEAAMARLVLNSDCSDSDYLLLATVLDYVGEYQPSLGNHRNLRHIEKNHNSTTGTEKSEIGFLHSQNKKMDEHIGSSGNDNGNVTTEGTIDVVSASVRKLFPLNCRDLCAGCVPRRCLVTKCKGYRRRQLKTRIKDVGILNPTPANDPCHYTVNMGENLINGYVGTTILLRSIVDDQNSHFVSILFQNTVHI